MSKKHNSFFDCVVVVKNNELVKQATAFNEAKAVLKTADSSSKKGFDARIKASKVLNSAAPAVKAVAKILGPRA